MAREGIKLDWSRIKTIFIICFLILDIYLIYEFLKIQDSNQVEVQTETEVSFEKGLKDKKITYVPLPKDYLEDYYLKAKPKVFTSEDLQKTIFSDQTTNIISGTVLESFLNKPLEIKDLSDTSEINNFIKNHVLYGDQYSFWEKNTESNTVTYYQQYDGKTLFENLNGKLIFYLNEDNKVISYQQTYLEEIGELSKSEKLIQPIKAIETLYTNDVLKPKSTITKVELGYYTLVPLSDATQVLNPAWRFIIDDKESLYVSAFEGKIVELNSEEKKVVE
jgi:regulatory protein YycI of two-component signal transduction system YycFG